MDEKEFSTQMIREKYPDLRGIKLVKAIANFKSKFEDDHHFWEFIHESTPEQVFERFEDTFIND